MNSLSLKLIALLITPLLLAGCPDRHKGASKPGPQMRKVKGDPYVFVKGTAMNRKNSIPSELLNEERKWKFGWGGYEEENADLPPENIETGHEAPERQSIDAEAQLNSWQVPATVSREGEMITFEDEYFKIVFKLTDKEASIHGIFNKIQNKMFLIGGELELLHTSIKDDQSAFSILIGSSKKGGRQLAFFVFTPGGPAKKEMFTTDNFYFLLGKGVKAVWPEPEKTLTICRSPSPGITQMFNDSVAEWTKHLRGRLTVKTAESNSCPPWTDLNSQTITVLDDWIEIEGEIGQTGTTQAIYDIANGHIADSDIFLYRGEIEEVHKIARTNFDVRKQGAEEDYRLQWFYTETVLHELGHWLGLHHNFEKGVASAMSYDSNVKGLQPYDIQAIQALYPLRHVDRP